jgi:hypothetical protein
MSGQNGKTPAQHWICERNPANNGAAIAEEIPGTTSNGQLDDIKASISEVERPK